MGYHVHSYRHSHPYSRTYNQDPERQKEPYYIQGRSWGYGDREKSNTNTTEAHEKIPIKQFAQKHNTYDYMNAHIHTWREEGREGEKGQRNKVVH